MALTPTDEQIRAIDLFNLGGSLAIQAGAGTGKTACLQMLAESAPHRTGQYTAFNKLIVTDAGSRMPSNVVCSTFHSLAMRAVGRRFRHRLGSGRMKSMDVARKLRIDPLTVTYGTDRKYMSPGYLAGLAMRTVANFCQSGDREPAEHHVPYVDGIDVPTPDGARGWSNNRDVRAHVLPAARRAWADLSDPDGTLTYTHAAYLKYWELNRPVIAADFLMVDEFQDVPGVMLSIIEQQTGIQLVGVGDSAQAINGWMGARDALGKMGAEHEAVLSQSFRFGPAVADVANGLLERIGSQMRLTGAAPWASVVAEIAEPTAVLTRTNAEAVRTVLESQRDGRTVHLTGGAEEVRSFARGATQLMADGWTSHHELACFSSWGEVQDYCLAPGSRLLTADLEWQEIESLEVGDKLVGFDEAAGPGTSGRAYRTATVTASTTIERPCWRITFEDGRSVVASIEHRWLTRTTKNNLRWQQTDHLRPGAEIASVGSVWSGDDSHDGGWLAGMFDGEGWVTRRRLSAAERPTTTGSKGTIVVGVSQNEGPVLERVRRLLKERGFTFNERDYRSCKQLVLVGGFAEKLRFLGSIRPMRLLENAYRVGAWDGNRVEARVRAVVKLVENVGEQEVVALTTDTGTFIAEGLLSHNCDHDEMGRELQLMVKLVDEFGADVIVDCLSRSVTQDRADLVVSTAHRSKGMGWDSVKLAGDFFEPRDGEPDVNRDELMLMYVACTRAKRELDVTLVPQALAKPERKPIPLPAATPQPAPAAAGYSGEVVTRGPVEVGR